MNRRGQVVETEAKFALPDAGALERLAAAGRLGAYDIDPGRTREISDTYLDTGTRSIGGAGYSCRRRLREGEIVMTLKQLATAGDAVHRREELETTLPADLPPTDWPESPARERVLGAAGESPLQTLVELRQTRVIRPVMKEGRQIAALSLDTVSVNTPGGDLPPYYEAEAELYPDGDEDDLAAIVACLRDEWKLEPERRSKFERALAAVERPKAAATAAADDYEGVARGVLGGEALELTSAMAQREDAVGRRARALLALNDGLTQRKVAALTDLAPRTVRYWMTRYRRDGLGIYPEDAIATAKEVAARAAAAAAAPAATRAERRKHPGIKAADTMAEAARKTLRFHFTRMVEHEPGTRLGEDPEELHDMRVATRRMRAALHVFGDHLEPQAMKPFLRGLRRTGRALGAVRDLDVFFEKTKLYLDALPSERKGELEPLLAVWRAERERARERLIAHLDGPRHKQFTERFGVFLEKPNAGARPWLTAGGEALPHRVSHVLPAVLYERVSAVRAYDEPLAEADPPLVRFHRLRIAGKFLRYTLEFFEEVLGAEAKPLIKTTRHLQDHLGDLQDAVVTCAILRNFLTWGAWSPPVTGVAREMSMIVAPGVAAYLAWRQDELRRLVDTFPETWAKVRGPEFNHRLAQIVAEL